MDLGAKGAGPIEVSNAGDECAHCENGNYPPPDLAVIAPVAELVEEGQEGGLDGPEAAVKEYIKGDQRLQHRQDLVDGISGWKEAKDKVGLGSIELVHSEQLRMPEYVVGHEDHPSKYHKVVIDLKLLESSDTNAKAKSKEAQGQCCPGPLDGLEVR